MLVKTVPAESPVRSRVPEDSTARRPGGDLFDNDKDDGLKIAELQRQAASAEEKMDTMSSDMAELKEMMKEQAALLQLAVASASAGVTWSGDDPEAKLLPEKGNEKERRQGDCGCGRGDGGVG